MKLLSHLIIPRPQGNATIQVLEGDLTAIPDEFTVDILAISAFRGGYEPYPGTLIDALFEAGISVAALAKDKELDLLAQLSCWLSKPLTETQQTQFNFRQILCFEPLGRAKNAEIEVGNLFRGINSFALGDGCNDIAMPVLATGNQQFPIDVMLPALLDAAIFWLESGLPLKSLKLVLHRADQVQIGLPIFETIRQQYELKKSAEVGKITATKAITEINALNQDTLTSVSLPKMEFVLQEMHQVETNESHLEVTRGLDLDDFLNPPKPTGYDYFISYSHKYTDAVLEFVKTLQARNPEFRIFYDRDSIPPGGLWIKMLSDSIQNSKQVICILTPEYSKSPYCWDEFQCAYIMEKRGKLRVNTINFCNDVDLPPMMAIYNFIDCTEGDKTKLLNAVEALVRN